MTYLHAAIRKGDMELVMHALYLRMPHPRTILEFFGFSILNSKNLRGETPILLTIALYNQNPKIYQKILENLLELGANPQICDSEGNIPLNIAAGKGFSDAVSILIRAGAHIGDEKNIIPLVNASRFGHIDIIKILLKHNAKVNPRNIATLTPLQAAAANGQYEAVLLLLKYKANVNAISITNSQGEPKTALWYAIDYSLKSRFTDHSLIKLLLINGADPNQCYNFYGSNHCAVMALNQTMLDYIDLIIQDLTEDQKSNLNISNPENSFIRNSAGQMIRYGVKQKLSST